MKRFILFGGSFTEIKGGWSDLIGDHDDIAIIALKTEGLDWWQIIDLINDGKIVLSSMQTIMKDDEEFKGGRNNKL